MQEFDIINNFFKKFSESDLSAQDSNSSDVILNIGDDAAVCDVSSLKNICITTDTLVAGVHFLESAPAKSIGHKSLAVNLSDLAAMGAKAKWFTLSLTLPEYNYNWLHDFSIGLTSLAKECNVKLVGGDLCKGPLSITITAIGECGQNKIITRSGAKSGDGIFITGDLGLPAGILDIILKDPQSIEVTRLSDNKNKLYYPHPRCNLGNYISNYASAMIDVSDGLLADLQHILDSSLVSANIYLEELPVSSLLVELVNNKVLEDSADKVYDYILSGGDEYELLFTSPIENKENLINNDMGIPVTMIGTLTESILNGQNKVSVIDVYGDVVATNIYKKGWRHFNDE